MNQEKEKKSSLSGENNRSNQGCKQGVQLVQSTPFCYRCRLQNSVKKIMAKKPKLTIVANSHERRSIETKILNKNIETKNQIWKSLNVVTVLYTRILKVLILLIIVKEKRKNDIAEWVILYPQNVLWTPALRQEVSNKTASVSVLVYQ